ncbi:MAG: lytic murein transglycosylase B [Gammaproteobacteria bacterium]|nr:lytic murein transglycosylase B [Gammaproteobacteria bacterium]
MNVFIDEMVSVHGFSAQELRSIFAQVTLSDKVLKAIRRPAERLPWYRYRKLLVTDRQVTDGVKFWREHETTLDRATQQFGVPPQIVVAIIGVETRYGRVSGNHSVINALTTLMLGYPRRSEFFRSELEQYLLLTREEELDPMAINGSYAGAMGVPQFISSSYRRYAVDFNGDDRRDLISDPLDAIGSVANYLHAHKWRRDEPVASDVQVPEDLALDAMISSGFETTTTITRLHELGLRTDAELSGDSSASLVRLDGDSSPVYRIAFDNFYVITRYNHSLLYAMAVYELSRQIEQEYSTL